MVELLVFGILGFLLAKTHGQFHPVAVVMLAILFAVLSARIFFPKCFSSQQKRPSILIYALIGLFFLALLWMNPVILYPTGNVPLLVMDIVLGFAATTWLCFVINLLISEKYFSSRISFIFFFLTAALLFIAKIFIIYISPAPHIDVHVVSNMAADFALQGKNPYNQIYPDIYNGAYAYAPNFVYGPTCLWWSLPFRLLGDVRFGYIVAEFLTLFGLLLFLKKYLHEKNLIYSIAILWLAFPVSLFVLEQAWIDPVIVMCFAWLAYFIANENFKFSAITAAFLAATKPYSLLIPFLTFVFLWRTQGRSKALRWALICGVVFLIILAPFLIDDASGFYKTTIQWMLHAPMRTDSLSLPSLWVYLIHQPVAGWLLTMIYFFALGITVLWQIKHSLPHVRVWLFAQVFIYGVIFLFGKQAFCNYYYLWAFFILTSAALYSLDA